MNTHEPVAVDARDPRIRAALAELRALIARHFPAATFTIAREDDPEGVYLTVTVDVEDLDAVIAVFLDRLIDMQVEEGLPVYVVPEQPIERVLAQMRRQAAQPVETLLPAS